MYSYNNLNKQLLNQVKEENNSNYNNLKIFLKDLFDICVPIVFILGLITIFFII